MTDEDGEKKSRRLYEPYGEVRYAAGESPTDVGFTGHRSVAGTGLIFMKARYYHPYLGRFISADTIVPEPGNPQDLNRYAYARNSPLVYTDPSGHFVLTAIAFAAGVALIADWGVQVHHNMQQGQTFWEAAYHKNLNEAEMAGAAVAGGTGGALAAAALPAVPAAVGATGLTGTSAGAATVATSAAVGGGASVTGEFTGRVVENELHRAWDEPTRSDLWNASTYRNDLVWGGIAGGAVGAYNVAAQSALSEAQARAATELRTQAANDLWDFTLQNGGQWPPGSWLGSASTEGLKLYLQWQCGPTAEQVAQATAEYAAMWQGVGDVVEIVAQDDAFEKAFPIWRDHIPE